MGGDSVVFPGQLSQLPKIAFVLNLGEGEAKPLHAWEHTGTRMLRWRKGREAFHVPLPTPSWGEASPETGALLSESDKSEAESWLPTF